MGTQANALHCVGFAVVVVLHRRFGSGIGSLPETTCENGTRMSCGTGRTIPAVPRSRVRSRGNNVDESGRRWTSERVQTASRATPGHLDATRASYALTGHTSVFDVRPHAL